MPGLPMWSRTKRTSGRPLHHLDDVRQVVVEDADVEGQVARGEEGEALEEVRPQAEVGVGLVLDQPPDRPELRQLAEPVEILGHRGAFLQVGAGDDALQARVA